MHVVCKWGKVKREVAKVLILIELFPNEPLEWARGSFAGTISAQELIYRCRGH